MRWLLRSALIASASAAVLAAPAQANLRAGSRTIASGPVSATLKWANGNVDGVALHPALTIVRNGRQLLHVSLGRLCQFCGSVVRPRRSLHLRDLDGDHEPEVLVDLFSGGAHCCSTTVIFYLKAAATGYDHRVASWGDDFYSLRDLDGDGRPEILTNDDRFAYAFTAFAFGWHPPVVYDFVKDRLVDHTRSFPDVVNADIAAIDAAMPTARHEQGDLRGLIAGRVADLYLLGRASDATSYLDAEVANGDADGDTTWPSGRKFESALLAFLKKTGYIR